LHILKANTMKIVFCLFNYFPYGGLQLDFMRITKACIQRGFDVQVYTTRWDGEMDPALPVQLVPVRGLTNHARAVSFARRVSKLLSNREKSLVVGFNKMPHLDIYYAADVCYQERIKANRGWIYRFLPRYRAWAKLEKAVFNPRCETDILLISALQQVAYTDCYGTQATRFHLLPPGIQRNRLAPPDASQQRLAMRTKLGLADDQLLLLMVGSGYKTKGLDRAIHSLAALTVDLRSRCHLYVVGKGRAASYIKLAQQLDVAEHVHIVGASNEVPQYLLAADLLLHPSYHENTGTVLLEALAAGLPVLTTAVCGYAHYILDAQAGEVVPLPFSKVEWNTALKHMLLSPQLKSWGANGLRFAQTADIYSMPERAADIIEAKARQLVLS
jgi:UDP-glucose:(heptosyl)LPS alpha-1,3-glucosyltransferase